MVFSSLVFLCLFLPATLALYYLCPERWRNHVALAASLFFYAWGAPRFVFVLLASCVVDHVIAQRLPPAAVPDRARRLWLALALALNLGCLAYFKYANFFVAQFNAFLSAAGGTAAHWTEVALPIGISFFTFHKISYLVDVYRGITPPADSLSRFVLYVVLFPQLIAGPIIRYHDIAAQLIQRRHTSAKMLSGVWRFCLGLGKKVLIANVAGEAADAAFACPPAQLGPAAAWFGAYCYAMQIFFDFSGYSDMAIGLARMLGFEFRENFRFPYVAGNFTEFWRRWHISLSLWMREYLYIPLGGNRVASWRRYLNLWIVFVLSGFWHGAAWNFVVWGAYHGLFLSLDKLREDAGARPLPRVIAVPLTFLLVLVGWVFFRANDLAHAMGYLQSMAGAAGSLAAFAGMEAGVAFDPRLLAALAAGTLVSFGPLLGIERYAGDWHCPTTALRGTLWQTVRFAAGAVLMGLSLMSLVTGRFNPFIYFRF